MPRRRLVSAILFGLALLAILAVVFLNLARPRPMRGAWITGYGTGYMTPAQVDRTIAAAKAAKLNALFIEVRRSANAYYRSSMEPMDPSVEPGFDPLANILRAAHAEGISVHAWVSVCRVWRGQSPPTDPDHLVNRHPDWLAVSSSGKVNAPDGVFIDPGIPEARDHVVQVVSEIVRRYDIDGLHLDFIRYPASTWGYSQTALRRFCAETGVTEKPAPNDPAWQQWRRNQVTNLVEAIRQEVSAAKPDLPISAATICYGECPETFEDTFAYKHLGQDWGLWLVNGLIDASMPMNYRDTRLPGKLEEFSGWLSHYNEWSGGRPVFVGLAAYMSDAETVRSQIDDVRRAGLDGFVVFCFNESGVRVNESRDHLVDGISSTASPPLAWRASCGAFLR